MTTVITCATNKGGGGKTTVELVLAAEAARRGARILLVDLDRNQSLTTHFGLEPGPADGIGYRLVKDAPLGDAIVEWRGGGERLDIIPMGVGFKSGYLDRALETEVDLLGLERGSVAAERARLSRLDTHLSRVKSKYDYVFIDIPNDDADVALNGIYASDLVLAPATPDPRDIELAMTGLRHVAEIRRDHKPGLAFGGFILNRVDRALLKSQERNARAHLARELRPLLFDASLRRANAALEASWQARMPANLHPRSRASGARDGTTFADDCSALWTEIEARAGDLAKNGAVWRTAFDDFVTAARGRGWQNIARGNAVTMKGVA